MTDSEGEVRTNTNFKFVPWQNVATVFPTDLKIDTDGYNPRDD